jgi:hypothetical protein
VDSVDRYPGSVSGVCASQITSGNGAAFRSRDDLDRGLPIASPNRGRSLATSAGDLSVSPSHASQRNLIPIGRFIDGVAKIHSQHNRYGAGIVNGKLKPEQNRFAPPILAAGLGQ